MKKRRETFWKGENESTETMIQTERVKANTETVLTLPVVKEIANEGEATRYGQEQRCEKLSVAYKGGNKVDKGNIQRWQRVALEKINEVTSIMESWLKANEESDTFSWRPPWTKKNSFLLVKSLSVYVASWDIVNDGVRRGQSRCMRFWQNHKYGYKYRRKCYGVGLETATFIWRPPWLSVGSY